MTSHTPGPWTVVDGHYPSFIEVKGPSFTVSIVVSATDLDFNDFMVRNADARLIAAAPELLRAAKEAESDLAWIEKTVPNSNFQSSLILLRAAIAKATGATP